MNGAGCVFFFEAAMSCVKRRSRVDSFFALMTQWIAMRLYEGARDENHVHARACFRNFLV